MAQHLAAVAAANAASPCRPASFLPHRSCWPSLGAAGVTSPRLDAITVASSLADNTVASQKTMLPQQSPAHRYDAAAFTQEWHLWTSDQENRGGVMGLHEKWTAARQRDRQAREANEARFRRFRKVEELRKLGVSVPTATGGLDSSLTDEALDAMLAAEKERRAELYQAFARVGTVTTFRAFGVQVLAGGDQVYTIGTHDPATKTNDSRLLGPLAGAEAKVTDGTSSFSWGKAMVMPIATAALARKETADAMVIFTDGTVHTTALDGSTAVRDARKQAVQFNALAGASAPPATEAGSDPAVKLRKLQELRDDGLLSQEEYEIKRAAVINSI